jgi:hypothetical protein
MMHCHGLLSLLDDKSQYVEHAPQQAFVHPVLGPSVKYRSKWYIDAAFAVHADMKSHTGAGVYYG